MDEALIQEQEAQLQKTGRYYKHICFMAIPLLCRSCYLYGLRPLLLCGIAVLTGNAVVKQQGRGEFHGDKLTYNTQSALITGEAGGDGLVHGVILPKAQPGAAPAPGAQVASPTCHPNAPAPAAAAPKPAGGH